ncbi:MAG TPA: hypothetical protein ENI70_01295, partial [Candidatus Peregrinibacteria bacterium]|nr:hypothetical protein [Candidatus Peregrinibacteria bacterium]
VNTLFGFILVAIDQQKKLLLINSAGVVFNIATNLILIPSFGFRGAAFTTILSEILIISLTYYYCKKFVSFSLDYKTLIKISLASLIMGGVILLFKEKSPFFTIPLGAAVFLLSALVLKIIPPELLESLKRKKEGLDFYSSSE